MTTQKIGPKEAELRALREKREALDGQLDRPRSKAERLKMRSMHKVQVVKLKSRGRGR